MAASAGIAALNAKARIALALRVFYIKIALHPFAILCIQL
jgi:hypothetical protein